MAFFCGPCSNGEWDDCELTKWFDEDDRVSLPIDPHVVVRTTHIEEGYSSILEDYDNVSNLVQQGRDLS